MTRGRLLGACAIVMGCAGTWLGGHCSSPVAPDGGMLDARDETLDARDATPADAACTPDPTFALRKERWVDIPSGTFRMGSPLSEPGRALINEDQVDVTLTHAFAMQRYEMTTAEWRALCVVDPSDVDAGDCIDPDCPVGHVTWFEAVALSNRLSMRAGLPECYLLQGCSGEVGSSLACQGVTVATSPYECAGYRLPTEAEWEYAYRAGTTTAFYSGSFEPDASWNSANDCDAASGVIEPIAWYCRNSNGQAHVVGQKAPNPFGLYDMSGNQYEWTEDTYDPNGYGMSPKIDPWSLSDMRRPVIRGGYYAGWPTLLRAARRLESGGRNVRGLGFRLVRTLPSISDSSVE